MNTLSPEMKQIVEVALQDVSDQQKYATVEVKQGAADRQYLDIHFKHFDPYDSRQYENFTAEILGNFAYLYLNSPFIDVRAKCDIALSCYQIHLCRLGFQ